MLVDEVKIKQPKVYRQWQEHPENVCPPDGEMLSEAVERIDSALEKMAKRHRNGSIGVVISEPLATLLAARLEGRAVGDLWKTQNGCTCCEEFELHPTARLGENGFVANGHAGRSDGK
jgi:probable phosphoglycerate mutase